MLALDNLAVWQKLSNPYHNLEQIPAKLKAFAKQPNSSKRLSSIVP